MKLKYGCPELVIFSFNEKAGTDVANAKILLGQSALTVRAETQHNEEEQFY
jgi:hypothetical protein